MGAQVCCATLMTPASAIHVKRVLTVTPTQSMARQSAPVPQVILGQLATWILMSALLVQTLVSMVVAASTPKALSSVSVFKDMKDLVARWMSMNACLILAIMMPPAWTRLEGSTAFACQDTRVCSATSTQMSAPANLVSTMASASTRSTPSTASAPKVFQGVCARWTLTSVQAPPARTELSVPTVPTSIPANVLKVTQGSTVRPTSMSATLTPATMAPVRMA